MIESKSRKSNVPDTFCVCLCLGWELGCGFGLDAPVRNSIVTPRHLLIRCLTPAEGDGCLITMAKVFIATHTLLSPLRHKRPRRSRKWSHGDFLNRCQEYFSEFDNASRDEVDFEHDQCNCKRTSLPLFIICNWPSWLTTVFAARLDAVWNWSPSNWVKLKGSNWIIGSNYFLPSSALYFDHSHSVKMKILSFSTSQWSISVKSQAPFVLPSLSFKCSEQTPTLSSRAPGFL